MIESAMRIFEQDTTVKIVTKVVTDAFYGKSQPTYTTQTVKAVTVPHGVSLQEPGTSIGIDVFGKIDIYVRGFSLKRDDLVTYCGKDYTIIDVSEWDSTLGDYKCYVAQI